MTDKDLENLKYLEAQLIERAWQDEAFRQELLGNPKAVIEAEFAKKLPDDLQFTVLEEKPNIFYLILPANPVQLANQELSLEAQVIERAWQDKAFRQELLRNPKAVIEAELGKKLPDDLQFTVLEETPNVFYLVLPANPDQLADQQLSAEELELVAGGSMFTLMGPNRLSLCIICR